MEKIKIIGACTDLGLEKNGTDKGPEEIIKKININNSILINKPNCIKSTDPKDLKKNLNEVNIFNNELFNVVKSTIELGFFPITIGGDHSMAIGSALASEKVNKNLGIIWIDAHLDYNTFETTITGNLHGLPLAAINGICPKLTSFTNNFINPKNTVVVGYRAKESNKEAEISNIKRTGVTVFDENDIKKYGIEYVMNKAIEIASNGTNGIHISYDLDVIDEAYAPGVSVPEPDGIDLNTAYKVANIIANNINKVKSFDIVEYNPVFDKEYKTRDIAVTIVNKVIDSKKSL